MTSDAQRRNDWFLAATVLLAAFLNLYGIWNDQYSNTYYTAAVTSMVQSWHNFFFASFDPGGFVSVDKPPVALWVQSAFAALLGVQGWSVILPQALANIGAVILIYFLVRPVFGLSGARASALIMACSPVAVAVSRSNNLDSILVIALLIGCGMLLRGLRQNQPGWVLGAFAMIGVGFNIKMLQAYLVLPAFYVAVLLMLPERAVSASPSPRPGLAGWKRKAAVLFLSTVVLLVVSLSWAVTVDSIPAAERPYVGGSDTNSVLELALGYNGLERLTGQNGNGPGGSGGPGGDGGMFGTGDPGIGRLFQEELSGQISWLLPLALLSSALLLSGIRRGRPLTGAQKETLFWLAWLLPTMAFFSRAMFFHQYYLTMLAPPVAVLAGTGWAELHELHKRREGWRRFGLPAAIMLTTAFALYIMWPYSETIGPAWLWGTGAAGFLVSAALLVRSWQVRWSSALPVAGLLVMLVGPLYWSATPIAYGMSSALPQAGPGGDMGSGHRGGPGQNGPGQNSPGQGSPPEGGPGPDSEAPGNQLSDMNAGPPGDDTQSAPAENPLADSGDSGNMAGPPAGNDAGNPPGNRGGDRNGMDTALLAYLTASNTGEKYLFACPDANTAGSYIIQTGRPVMAMGGFGGSDPILTADSLQALVEKGEVKFFMLSGGGDGRGGRQSELTQWIIANSTVVSSAEWQENGDTGSNPGSDTGNSGSDDRGGGFTLYRINL